MPVVLGGLQKNNKKTSPLKFFVLTKPKHLGQKRDTGQEQAHKAPLKLEYLASQGPRGESIARVETRNESPKPS